MATKADHVRSFFNKPHLYLSDRGQIATRHLQVRELLSDVEGLRILDIGCGDGTVSIPFSDKNELTLVDGAERMLEVARSNTPTALEDRVTFVRTDLLDFSPGEQYDVVICLGVLAHVESVGAAVAKLANLTAPGGRVVLQLTDASTACGYAMFGYTAIRNALSRDIRHSINRLSTGSVVQMCQEVGLSYADKRTSWPLLPGFGRLPLGVSRRCRATLDGSPRLRSLGSEVMILLSKD
jgi:ubiquinone/menaquinone biosynthesis C-methylase UbiE